MNCPTCEGRGVTIEVNPGGIGLLFPCHNPECHGGKVHCCDGDQAQPDGDQAQPDEDDEDKATYR